MFSKKRVPIDIGPLNDTFEKLTKKLDQLVSGKNASHQMEVDRYLHEFLYNNPKYQNNKRLNRFEHQVFSQFGEDGIINEIFNRVSTTNKYFIEFGVENGTECNTTNLLFGDWQGLWIEGNREHCESIRQQFSNVIRKGRLVVSNGFINTDNIEKFFEQANTPIEPDLLSIDIDRNDYHVWKAIRNYRPRVVIIEYNAVFRPGCHFVVDYDAGAVWDGSSNFGASLDAYYQLGLEKGYKLVGCSFSGVNAFFVREDLTGDHFENPFTPVLHYEPPRYFLYKKDGHYRKIQL